MSGYNRTPECGGPVLPVPAPIERPQLYVLRESAVVRSLGLFVSLAEAQEAAFLQTEKKGVLLWRETQKGVWTALSESQRQFFEIEAVSLFTTIDVLS